MLSPIQNSLKIQKIEPVLRPSLWCSRSSECIREMEASSTSSLSVRHTNGQICIDFFLCYPAYINKLDADSVKALVLKWCGLRGDRTTACSVVLVDGPCQAVACQVYPPLYLAPFKAMAGWYSNPQNCKLFPSSSHDELRPPPPPPVHVLHLPLL